mgnify:CR=1 FL=1
MTSSPLLINEPPLQVLPTLAQRIGLNEAIIVQQVHYWLNPKFNKNYFEGRYWVWNTYEQWQRQFPFWGMNTIRRAIANLEESKILLSFVTRDFKKLKYYSINYDLLQNFISNKIVEETKTAENQITNPSAQNEQIDLLKSTDQENQDGQIDLPKMSSLYNNDTENTNSENTLHQSSFQRKEKDEDLKKMLTIWNEIVQHKLSIGKDVHLTSKRISALKACFAKVFNKDQSAWKSYCEQISNSKFLMGSNASGFRVTLDWAIVIDNAYKVLEGAIYDKSSSDNLRPIEISKSRLLDDIRKKILVDPSQEIWLQISELLIDKLGSPTYKSWFSHIVFVETDQRTVILRVLTRFIRDYIFSNFLQELETAAASVLPFFKEIILEINFEKEL